MHCDTHPSDMALSLDRKLEVSQKADSLLLKSGVSLDTPINTEAIARHLNYTVGSFVPDPSTKEISGAVDHEKKHIFLNGEEAPVRQHFTLAHEIGHVVLHAGESIVDFRTQINAPASDREFEANYFASCLLMPSSLFFPQWIKQGGDVKILGRIFGVSSEAVNIRAKELKLL